MPVPMYVANVSGNLVLILLKRSAAVSPLSCCLSPAQASKPLPLLSIALLYGVRAATKHVLFVPFYHSLK